VRRTEDERREKIPYSVFVSAVAFELNSPERESGEDSTTPCGLKGTNKTSAERRATTTYVFLSEL
jgi:hypothetical protein